MRVRTAILLLLVVLLLVSTIDIVDARKAKKGKRRSKSKKKKKKKPAKQQGDNVPKAKTANSGVSPNLEKQKNLKKPRPPTSKFTASGTVLGLSNDPITLTNKKYKSKKRTATGQSASKDKPEVAPMITLAATPIDSRIKNNGIIESKVDPLTGKFIFDSLEPAVEYDVTLGKVPSYLSSWGFKLSPSSIRVANGIADELSFIAIPSPPKTGHTISGVVEVGDKTNLLEKVQISLYRNNDAEKKLVQRSALKESQRAAQYFSFGGLGNGRYTVVLSVKSTELDTAEVLVDSENTSSPSTHVILSALSKEGTEVQFDQDVKDDDVNIVGSFVSILLASLVFAAIMFPSISGSLFLPLFTMLKSMARANSQPSKHNRTKLKKHKRK